MQLKMLEAIGSPDGLTEAFNKWFDETSLALNERNVPPDGNGYGRETWFVHIHHTTVSMAVDGEGRLRYIMAVFYDEMKHRVRGRELLQFGNS